MYIVFTFCLSNCAREFCLPYFIYTYTHMYTLYTIYTYILVFKCLSKLQVAFMQDNAALCKIH